MYQKKRELAIFFCHWMHLQYLLSQAQVPATCFCRCRHKYLAIACEYFSLILGAD